MAARAADPWYNAADTNLGSSYRIDDNAIYELLWNRGRAQRVPDGSLITRENVALEIQRRNPAQLFQFPMARVQAAVSSATAQQQQATHSPRLPTRLIRLMQQFEQESNRLATELNIGLWPNLNRDLYMVLAKPEDYVSTPRLYRRVQELIQQRGRLVELFREYVSSKQIYFRDRSSRGLFHMNPDPRKLIVILVGHGGMSPLNIRIPANVEFRTYNPPSLISLLLPYELYWNQGYLHVPAAYNNGEMNQFFSRFGMALHPYRLVPNITFHASNPVPETLNFGNRWNTVKQMDAAGIYIFYEGDYSDFEFIPHSTSVLLCGGNTLQQIIAFLQGYIQTRYGKNTFELVSLLCQSVFQSTDSSLSSIFEIFSDSYDFGPDLFAQDKKSKIMSIFSTFVFSNIEMKTEDARSLQAKLSQLMNKEELIRYLIYLRDGFEHLLALNHHVGFVIQGHQIVIEQDRKIRTMIQIVINLLSDPTLYQGKKTKKHKRTKSKGRKYLKHKRNSRK